MREPCNVPRRNSFSLPVGGVVTATGEALKLKAEFRPGSRTIGLKVWRGRKVPVATQE